MSLMKFKIAIDKFVILPLVIYHFHICKETSNILEEEWEKDYCKYKY